MLVQPLLQWRSNKYYVFWECVALSIQQAMHMRHTYGRLYNIFPRYLINGTIFRKSYWTYNVCFEFFYIFFFLNISHSKQKWARYDKKCILVFMQSALYPLHLSDFNESWIYATTDFGKIFKFQVSWKSV